jgi:hypothetical protein
MSLGTREARPAATTDPLPKGGPGLEHSAAHLPLGTLLAGSEPSISQHYLRFVDTISLWGTSSTTTASQPRHQEAD